MTVTITREKVIANIPQTLVVFVLLLTTAALFVKGGLPTSSWLTGTIAMATPFAVMVSEGILARRFIRMIMKREKLVESLIFIVSWISVILIGIVPNPFGLGRASDLYKNIYNVAAVHGEMATTIVGVYALYYLMITDLKPSRMANIIIIVGTIFAVLYITPVGDLIYPGLALAGQYLYMYPGAVGASIHWYVIYLGTFGLVMRALFYKERLRGGD